MHEPNLNNLNMIYKKYRVTGRVQGVFYRQSTYQKATELGLTGYVQNQPNGEVYVWAKGEADMISQLEKWLMIGPPRASVSGVILLSLTPEEIAHLDRLTDFTIAR